MNFFEYQDRAHQNTKKLIGLFSLSIALMIVMIYGVLFRMFPKVFGTSFNLEHFSLVADFTLILIALGTLYKMLRLREGGRVIAQQLGGKLLYPEIANQQEQQLLNVVEEMAIASGIPVPEVYILNLESGINAFAAGFTPNDAVIGVTKGTLQHLTRDELQGVIGHEFSHILNGDMRLNLYLVAMLNGILCIYLLGSYLWRLRDYAQYENRENRNLAFFWAFLGLLIMLIGGIGLIFGRLIKAAVSRQREFLADASSVQFTRNPDGLAGALQKLQQSDSRLYSSGAEVASHMFFGNGVNLSFWGSAFYTHPSLAQRIRRIGGSSSRKSGAITPGIGNQMSYSESSTMGFAGGDNTTTEPGVNSLGSIDTERGQPTSVYRTKEPEANEVGSIQPEHLALEQALLSQLPEPLCLGLQDGSSLIAMVFALALDTKNIEIQERQIAWLQEVRSTKLARKTLLLSKEVSQLDTGIHLPLVDLTVLTLRQYAPQECFNLSEDLQGFILAGESDTLSSLVLELILCHRLAPSMTTVKLTSIEEIWTDALLVLSALAEVGHSQPDEIAYAFRSGVFRLPGAARQEKPEAPLAYDIPTLKKSLERLCFASSKLKQALVDACAHMVLLDHQFTTYEADLLRAIAITLSSPVPPFLNA